MKSNGNIKKSRKKQAISDLTRLLDALQNPAEGSIFLVVFDEKMTLKKVSYELTRELGNAVQVVSLAKEKKPLEKLTKIHRQRSRSSIIFLQHLENHLNLSKDNLTNSIFTVLEEQFAWCQKFKKVLILAIPIEMVSLFQKEASGLWERHSGLFFFDESIKDPLQLSHFLCDHFANSYAHKWYTEKQNLLAFYRLLKMESQTLAFQEKIFFEYDLSGKIGRLLYKSGNYQDAFKQFEKQYKIGQSIEDKALLPETLNNLGIVCESQGCLQDALKYFQKSLEAAEAALRGEFHPVKAIISNNIGRIYWTLGNEDAANHSCRNARRIIEHKLGNRHPLLVPLLINLNGILIFQKNYEEALDNYRCALQLVERLMGLDHPYISVLLQDIGITYYYQQKYELALRYISRNMEALERTLGSEHPYLSRPITIMGLVHWRCGHIKSALSYLYWALDLRYKVTDRKDPEIAGIFSQLGKIYQEQANISDAQLCFDRALDIYNQCLPEDHLLIQEIENNILQLQKMVNTERQKSAS